MQKKNLPRAHASPLIDFFIRCLYLGPSNDNGCEDLHVFAHALVFALAHRNLNVDTLRHDNIDALQQCYAHGTACVDTLRHDNIDALQQCYAHGTAYE